MQRNRIKKDVHTNKWRLSTVPTLTTVTTVTVVTDDRTLDMSNELKYCSTTVADH